MKDILVTVKQQKREIKYLLISFLLAVSMNIFAIIYYDTDFRELYTQFFTIFLLTIAFYILIALFRLIYWWIARSRSSKTNG
ncbi:MAG: hypothetical protein LBQ60_14395 [Bacteroidales bacterium]|jgi:predicted tellurium resistance membrane protein TerC|nr:hypothetical protein [Bacteroidales bacterium]